MEKPRTVFRDYYYILGLKPNATQGQIQAAFNELYAKFGPHVSPEDLDPEAMTKAYKDISEAFEVLKDPVKRQEYDQKALQNQKESTDIRDLWLKKTGMPTGDAELHQPGQQYQINPANPSSFMRRSSASNPVLRIEIEAQEQSGAYAPAFIPASSSFQSHSSQAQTQSAQNETGEVSNFNEVSEPSEVGNFNLSELNNPHDRNELSVQNTQRAVYESPAAEPAEAVALEPVAVVAIVLALEVEVTVSLREAFKGCKKEVMVADPVSCSLCVGLMPVLRMQCTQCRGVGTYNVDRREELELPPGMYEGMEISRPGQGRYDVRAGRQGDLIVKIKLARHPLLGVNGKDITCSVPVNIYEAMLGAEIDVPCATGKVRMKIQPLTQPGRVYRLKGLGLAEADQLVTIEVVLPSRMSAEEIAVYKKLRDAYHEPNPREKFFQQQQQ